MMFILPADSRLIRGTLAVVALWGVMAISLALDGCRPAGRMPPEAASPDETTSADRTPPETASPGETTSTEIAGEKEQRISDLDDWSPPRFTARQKERDAMAQDIQLYGLKDEAILKVMSTVPRHEFVPEKMQSHAYADSPLPIGYGQTISQPFIVAEMTRQLKLTSDSRVLEIGTGSGYQAAMLAEFTTHVYSIEIVKPLAEAAKKRLKDLGYDVVRVRVGDGYYGWPEEAPFDAIIVTCAAGEIPSPLIKQLVPGGRMVIPVGGAFAGQSLMLLEKDKDGTIRSRSLMGVRFVPLVRKDVSAD